MNLENTELKDNPVNYIIIYTKYQERTNPHIPSAGQCFLAVLGRQT